MTPNLIEAAMELALQTAFRQALNAAGEEGVRLETFWNGPESEQGRKGAALPMIYVQASPYRPAGYGATVGSMAVLVMLRTDPDAEPTCERKRRLWWLVFDVLRRRSFEQPTGVTVRGWVWESTDAAITDQGDVASASIRFELFDNRA